jgi:hypothetical protein
VAPERNHALEIAASWFSLVTKLRGPFSLHNRNLACNQDLFFAALGVWHAYHAWMPAQNSSAVTGWSNFYLVIRLIARFRADQAHVQGRYQLRSKDQNDQKINVKLIVVADEAEVALAELNAALDLTFR